MSEEYRFLTNTDILDFYGLSLLHSVPELSKDDKAFVEASLEDIRQIYVDILKKRIIAEAKFLGVKDGPCTLADLINDVNDLLDNELESQAESMMTMGAGFDFRNIAQTTSQKLTEKKDLSKPESFLNDAKWKIIAEACVAIEKAKTTKETILAIDHLNDLQHNSFHVLIDLQSGRMLDSSGTSHQDAKAVLDEVLNLKAETGSVVELAHKMSKEVRKLINEYKFSGSVS